MQTWLSDRGIPYLPKDKKKDLMARIEANKKRFPTTYVVDEKLKAAGRSAVPVLEARKYAAI